MLPVETPSQRAERLARERRLSSPETEEQRAERLAMLDRPEDDRAGRIARNLGIPQVEADIIAGSSFATGPRVEAPEEPFYQAQENFGLPTRPEDIDKAPWARTKSAAYADVFDQLAKQPGFLPKQTPGEQDALLYGAMRNIAIDQAIRANPDEEARIRDLARKLQLPSAMVRAIGQAEANNRIVKQQAQQALGTAPSLAKAFMQPDFAKLAADDLQSLSGIERTLRELFGGGEQSANSAALAELEYKRMEGKTLRPSEIMEYQRLKARNAVLQQQQEMTENGVTWTTNALASGVTDFALGIPEAATYGLAGSLFGMPQAGFALGQVTYNFRQIAGNSFEEYSNFRDDLGRLIDQDVARGAAYINASLSVGLEVIGERAQLRAVPGFDKLVGGKDAIKKLLQTEAGRNVMMRVGKKIATGAIVEGVTEGLQELSQIAIGEAAKTVAPGEFAPVTTQDVFARVGEAAAAGALVGGAIVGTTAPIQVAIENRELRKADITLSTSQGSIDRIETVLNIASESKLIARDRGELEKFIDDAAADGPVSTVYFSADDLANVAREAGLEPQQLAQQLGVTDQIQPASVTNALLEMPVGKFIATVADTDLAKPLIQVIKTNPFLLNRAEQEAYSSGGRQDIIAEADRLVQQALTDETFAAEAQSIQDEVLQQFRAFEGGEVFTPEVNRAYATITTQGYVSLARRMGISPREAYQKYQTGPLQIQRQAPTEEGMGQPVLAQAKQVGYEGQNIGEATEWVRAREKGLDMSQEGRLQRAREMGFDTGTVLYHATNADFKTFDNARLGQTTAENATDFDPGSFANNLAMLGNWFSDRPLASRVAAAIDMPVVTRGRLAEFNSLQELSDAVIDANGPQDFRQLLKDEGFDGVRVQDEEFGGTSTVIFNPSNIRSVNAAFDPEFAESANILAQDLIPPDIQAEMVRIYNENIGTEQEDIDRFINSRDAEKYYWNKITEQDLIDRIGADEDVNATFPEAMEIIRQEGAAIEYGTDNNINYAAEKDAPKRKEFYADAAYEEGWVKPRPETIDDILQIGVDEFAASQVMEYLAETEGWTATKVRKNYRYQTLEKEVAGGVVYLNVRISDHAKQSAVGHAVYGKDDIDINLAPSVGEGNEQYAADDFNSMLMKMREAEQRGPLDENILGQERELDAMGFVSLALEAAKALPDRRMTFDEAAGRIAKGRGLEGYRGNIKDEIEALGLRDAFGDREKVTREDIVQFIENARIVLQEVTASTQNAQKPTKEAFLNSRTAKDHMSMNGRSMYFGEIEVTSSAKPDYVSMGDGFKAIDMEGDEFKVTRVLAQKKRATGKWTLYHDTEFTDAIRELDIDPEGARTIDQVKEAVLDEFRTINFDRLKRKLKTYDTGYSEYVEEVSMGGLRVGTSYDVDQDPKIVRGETSLVFDGEQVKDLPPGGHTGIDNELLHIFWAVRKDENGQDTLFTRQLQSDLVQQTRRKKEEAQKRIKSLRVYQRENEYYVRSIEGETGPYATEAEAKQALESAKTDTSKDIRFPLARTQQWTGAGVRAMLIRAARDGYSSISFPTGNTSALIQGNRSASGHYNTNVKGALERVAQIYGGKVREGFVRTDAEGFRIINKKGASLGAWPTVARAEKIIRETIDYYKENEILSDDWNAPKTGTRFEDFSIEDASIASTYVLDITPEMRARILGEGVPLFAPGRRAQYQPDLNRIMLLPKADWSSYLHEMGHHFLEVYNNAALQISQIPEADRTPDEQKLVDDMSLLLTDMARQAGTPITGDVLQWWANTPLPARTPVHEKYAQATEKYFMEGKAPVPELQSLFDKFRDWLIETYKRLATALNVELSDEVRGVMDRMYAAHETVRTAEYNRKLVALFREKPEDMTEQEWTAYQQLAAQATDDAQSDLTARSLRDMQWMSGARARVMRELQRENADKRKVVAAEVTAEVMAQPVNVARSFLRRGIAPNGEPVVGPHKLSIDLLKARYPDVANVEWKRLGYGQYGMLAKDGMDPDMAAELLGYPSGDAMINDLLSAPPSDDVIKTETDRRMLERFGDLNDETKLSRAADDVIHSAMRAKVLQAEYAALSKAAKQTRPVALAAKEIAKEIVGRQVASKLNLNRYLAAERAAGRKAEAAMRSGDFRAAASAKRDQLLNFEVVREVQRVLKERNRALDLFSRINKAKRDTVAKTRNYDLVQAARAILAAYGFGSVKNKPMDYMAAVKAYDPALYTALEPTITDAIATKKTIDQLTVSEFLGMRDVVKKFWDLSREEMKVDIEGRQLELADVVQELTVQLEAQGVTPKGPSTQTPSEWQKRLRQFAGLKAGLRRVESWARLYDGGKVAAFTKYIWRPVSEAADRYRADRNKYILKYRELFRVIEPTMGGGKIIAPEINFTFRNKSELLHAIMHTGNSSNYRKLLLGRGWGTEDQDGNLIDNAWRNLISRLANQGILTKADFDFAQSVWDLLEEIKPLAQAAHKKVFGSYFSEITAEEVQTPFGTYKGGYIPAVYDTYNVQDAALRAQQEAVEANDSTMFPSPASGFTKSRVDYNKELALDLMILPQHIDKVLKFAHLASPVRDVLKILKNRSFSAVLESADPTAQSDILLPWLTRAARQIIEEPTKGQGGPMIDLGFRIIRQRAGMGLMFANLVNVAQQVTGFSVAALQVKPRYLASGLIRYTRNPMAITKAIRQASPMMADRGDNQLAAMYGTIDKIIDKDNKYAQVQDWFGRHTYFMQQGVQNVMDVIVWLGAYDQALAQGATDQEAAKQGDAAVRQTQGSTLPEDVSRIETGTPMLRSFVHMYGYFNMWGNVLSTEVRTLMRDMGLKKGAGRLMFVYIAGFAVPALLAQVIADGMRGQLPEDEDDDGWLEEWLAWYFGTQAKTVTAFAPIVGQAINAIPGAWTSVPYDDRIAGSPAISVVEGGLRTISGKTVYDAIAEDGDKSKAIKDVLSLITLVTGVPVQALSRPIGYAVDVAEGDIEPTSELDYIRGLVTGTASEASRQ